MKQLLPTAQCPCGSDKEYGLCCQTFIEQLAMPLTPEQLMRSRYTAYVVMNVHYLLDTMLGDAAKSFSIEKVQRFTQRVKWLGLKVLSSKVTEAGDVGFVEYKASYQEERLIKTIHEKAQFIFKYDRWYYIDGQQFPSVAQQAPKQKLGRNDPCPCGSGKKYKKCCLSR